MGAAVLLATMHYRQQAVAPLKNLSRPLASWLGRISRYNGFMLIITTYITRCINIRSSHSINQLLISCLFI